MQQKPLLELRNLNIAINTDRGQVRPVRDMVASEHLFTTPKPGEVLEVFQLKNGKQTSLLRIPDTSPPRDEKHKT